MSRRKRSLPLIFAAVVMVAVAACGGQAEHQTRTIAYRHAAKTTTTAAVASQGGHCRSFKSTANGTIEKIGLSPTKGISCLDAYVVMHDYVNGLDLTQLNGDSKGYTKVAAGWRCESRRGTASCTRGPLRIKAKVSFSGQDYSGTSPSA